MQRLYERLAAPLATIAEIGAGARRRARAPRSPATCASPPTTLLSLPRIVARTRPGAGGCEAPDAYYCGPGVAKRMILGAELVSGAQAIALGIVQVGRAGATRGFASDLAERLSAMPKESLAANKRCIAAQTDPARRLRRGWPRLRALRPPQTRQKVTAFLHATPEQHVARTRSPSSPAPHRASAARPPKLWPRPGPIVIVATSPADRRIPPRPCVNAGSRPLPSRST